jgi:hypothetical protein
MASTYDDHLVRLQLGDDLTYLLYGNLPLIWIWRVFTDYIES